jgi:uncharacterized membrane protein
LSPFRAANLALRFLLELTALGALGYWGAQQGSSTVVRMALVVLCPMVMIIVWGFFVAPKARYGGTRAQRLLLGQLVFLVVAAAIASLGYAVLGGIFAALTALNTTIAYAAGPQPGEISPEGRR